MKNKPFREQFKSGDVICSDEFHSGKCMIVQKGEVSFGGIFCYNCEDLIIDNQGWCVYEYVTYNQMMDGRNEWRLATDEDICNYIARFLDIRLDEFEEFTI